MDGRNGSTPPASPPGFHGVLPPALTGLAPSVANPPATLREAPGASEPGGEGSPVRDAHWTALVDRIRELQRLGQQHRLEVGDRLVEIESRRGERRLPHAAKEAGMRYHAARKYYWVAKRIPPHSPIRQLRLRFAHLCAVAGTRDPIRWAERAAQQRWTRDELAAAIRAAGEGSGRRNKPAPWCEECEQPLPGPDEIIAVRISREKPVRCCSLACHLAYVRGRVGSRLAPAETASAKATGGSVERAAQPASASGEASIEPGED